MGSPSAPAEAAAADNHLHRVIYLWELGTSHERALPGHCRQWRGDTNAEIWGHSVSPQPRHQVDGVEAEEGQRIVQGHHGLQQRKRMTKAASAPGIRASEGSKNKRGLLLFWGKTKRKLLSKGNLRGGVPRQMGFAGKRHVGASVNTAYEDAEHAEGLRRCVRTCLILAKASLRTCLILAKASLRPPLQVWLSQHTANTQEILASTRLAVHFARLSEHQMQ